jgi:hypothetical protein
MPAAVTCLFEVLFLYLFPVRGTGRGFRSRSRHKHGPLAASAGQSRSGTLPCRANRHSNQSKSKSHRTTNIITMDDNQEDNESIFQEKYKVQPTPYKKIDNSIDQLDSDFDLHVAIDKLLLDNYVENPKTEPHHADSFYITYHGRLFFRKYQSFILKNRPYKRQQIIDTIQSIYTITKTVATISYSLIIVFIAYWGVKLTDKANRLEDDLKKNELIHRQQIDSLNRMLNDTTRLKK